MHYRIFSILVTFVCLFGCALTTAAQDVNNTDETEKPVILYSGTPKKYEIADIKVEGAQNYEDYVIVGLSGLSKGQTITVPGDEITQACKRYWRHGLFSDVEITADKIEGDQIWLTIHLTMRPRVSDIRYNGVKKSEREDLESRIGMIKGGQITPNLVDRAKTLIKRYFDDKGFKNADVIITQRDDPEKKNEVIVNIDIDKKEKVKVHQITIVGNEALTTKKLKRVMKKTNEKGKLLTGGTVDSVVAMLEGLRVDALGVNCGLGPKQMHPIIERLTQVSSLPIIVNPNAGLPRSENGKTVFDIAPAEFSDLMEEIAGMGVQALGGCCGTTPEHLRLTIEKCRKVPFRPPVAKRRTVVSSFSQAVEIGPKPVIIGERINPTGKSKFKAALRENNIEYILGEGMAQEDSGAHILDVNVGLPEIDEPVMMERVVTRLQSVIALPLQIDTSDTIAMERGMRLYNGKPMINSVSGKMESMEAVFPLVRKYGGVVVGLALDENGIPATAEGRIQVAKKIYDTAEKYGIPHEDIVIDGLAMTISSDSGSALVTLETLRRVRDELHGHSILGVSNISFGLPQREIVNSNFFTMALQSGLSCAIINPNMDAMMRSYRAYLALANLDEQCAGYIAAYGNQPAASAAPAAAGGAAMPLGESIERGLGERAVQAAKEMLQTAAPLDVVNGELIPALDRVGKGFEKGTVFLPQLLMSAEAAKAAFEVVKEAMKGEDQQTKGKIILATVKGDIHDIGKNIVKVLLENYAYQVLDLGKDVPPEVIVDTAIREDIKVVGLSALMTTTVVSMEETIRQLREKKPDTKVVVGGAVLTQEYADSIGADCYAKDAMATVHFADSVFGV